MIPYRTLNTIISTIPVGLPLAQRISDVTPTREAARFRKFSRSNMRNAVIISPEDMLHKRISVFVKDFSIELSPFPK